MTLAPAYFFRYAAAPNPPYSSPITTSTAAAPSTWNGFCGDTVGAVVDGPDEQPLRTAPPSTPCNKVRRLSTTAG